MHQSFVQSAYRPYSQIPQPVVINNNIGGNPYPPIRENGYPPNNFPPTIPQNLPLGNSRLFNQPPNSFRP